MANSVALSSVAYGPEAVLVVLVAAGTAGLSLVAAASLGDQRRRGCRSPRATIIDDESSQGRARRMAR